MKQYKKCTVQIDNLLYTLFKVSECVKSDIRGTLGSIPALFMALGTLVTYVVGAILPWHLLSYFCDGFPILLLIGVLVLPESPAWLISKGKFNEAKKSLTWLRKGSPQDSIE